MSAGVKRGLWGAWLGLSLLIGACGGGETVPFCGNGVVDGEEACDDGNALTEACAAGEKECTVCGSTCQLIPGAVTVCGDGRLDEGEACDDGNNVVDRCAYGQSACEVCSPDCRRIPGVTSECGDGVVDAVAGEACDDGNAVTEPCPDGGVCEVCDAQCQWSASAAEKCGDGVVQASRGETCDDGNLVLEACAYGAGPCVVCGPACTEVAGTERRCGDGVTSIQAGETCDDGNQVTERCPYGVACTVCDATCRSVVGESSMCGNGVVDTTDGETCDDGNGVTESCAYGETGCVVCDAACQEGPGLTAWCGDGRVDPAFGEACDEGSANSEACPYNGGPCTVCGTDCQPKVGTTSRCGDGQVDFAAGETCDDSNTVTEACAYGTSCQVCSGSCILSEGARSVCGDRIVNGDEECDDGNSTSGDGCEADCKFACGGKSGQSAAYLTGTGCYLTFAQNKSWYDAQSHCASLGFDLVTVNSAHEHAYLALIHPGATWIGLSDLASEGRWAWQSGRPLAFTAWRPQEPNGALGENCVEASGGGWNDNGCSKAFPYVCANTTCGNGMVDSNETCDDNSPIPQSGDGCSAGCVVEGCGDGILQSGEQCDDGNRTNGDGCESNCQFICGANANPSAAKIYRGSCYVRHENSVVASDTGQSLCAAAGGHLVTIDDAEENEFVRQFLFKPRGSLDQVHIGLTDVATEGTFVWRSGQPVTYSNRKWSAGNPDTEDCWVLNRGDGRWDDVPCTNHNLGRVCELPLATCGNGVVNAGLEECDDGNAVTESCAYGTAGCIVCNARCQYQELTRVCGDGKVTDAEACDDGNSAAGDGCESCAITAGFTCAGQPSRCFESTDVYSVGPNLNVSPVDDAYDGSLDTMRCVSVEVPPAASGTGAVKGVTVRIAAAALTVRDSTLKLVSPSFTVVTLMSLPGVAEVRDDGTTNGLPTAPSLAIASPITFADGAKDSAEDMGIRGNNVVACASDGICVFDPNAGAAHPGKLAAFIGQRSEGTWRLCAGDSEGNAATLRIDSVQLSLRR